MTVETDRIEHIEEGSKGRYTYTDGQGGPEAEMTYSRLSPAAIIIDHTGVPDAYRSQGVGAALVARAVADARQSGTKITPLCPFAAAQFRRHPDWADVLA